MPALGEQPDLESGARREPHAFEEIPTQAGEAERLHPRPGGQGADVDERARVELQLEGLAADRGIGTQEAAQLAEVPAQGIEGILSVREEELGEPFAAGSGFRRQEVGEQRPGFATAGCSPPSRTARHERCPEQVDRERSRHARSVPPIAARSVAAGTPFLSQAASHRCRGCCSPSSTFRMEVDVMDPDVISATIDRFSKEPEAARSAPAVAGRVVDGRAELSVGSFTWYADLPAALGGTNTAPSPTAYLLGALAGSVEVEITVVSSEPKSRLDVLYQAWLERCPIYLALLKPTSVAARFTLAQPDDAAAG